MAGDVTLRGLFRRGGAGDQVVAADLAWRGQARQCRRAAPATRGECPLPPYPSPHEHSGTSRRVALALRSRMQVVPRTGAPFSSRHPSRGPACDAAAGAELACAERQSLRGCLTDARPPKRRGRPSPPLARLVVARVLLGCIGTSRSMRPPGGSSVVWSCLQDVDARPMWQPAPDWRWRRRCWRASLRYVMAPPQCGGSPCPPRACRCAAACRRADGSVSGRSIFRTLGLSTLRAGRSP